MFKDSVFWGMGIISTVSMNMKVSCIVINEAETLQAVNSCCYILISSYYLYFRPGQTCRAAPVS